MIKADILTIFPDQVNDFMKFGIFRIAQEAGALQCKAHDLRKWTTDKHRTVDDRPYGGGAGMLMKVEPIHKAIAELSTEKTTVIALTPSGETLNQERLKQIASDTDQHIILIAGHYEGFDQRILDYLVDLSISVGEYVLSGGELPALTLIDGIARLLPGVLGNEDSAKFESHEGDSLEYAQYTRPEDYQGWKVPEVLLSGNHKEITEWRQGSSNTITKKYKRG